MTIGNRLKQYRTENNLSQEQLAEQLNVSRQAITKWETDKGLPDITNLVAISNLMEISLDTLVKGEAEVEEMAENAKKRTMLVYGIVAVIHMVAGILQICGGYINLFIKHRMASGIIDIVISVIYIILAIMFIKMFQDCRSEIS